MSQSDLKQNLLGFLRKQPNADERRAAAERDLINAESALGRTLFGDAELEHFRAAANAYLRLVKSRIYR